MRDTTIGRRRIFTGVFLAFVFALALVSAFPAVCQETGSISPTDAGTEPKLLNDVYEYLNVANQGKPVVFQPLSQKERNQEFTHSLINPIWHVRGALSAGSNQLSDTPHEWEQGMSGYGKRFADIMGQYAIRKTMMYGFESLLHEDNRYFGSGKKGFWSRTGYALSSGIMARHDNGKRYPSASLLIGFAGSAYLSRFWQPPSSNSVGDAASSFGISLGWNTGFGVLKEYLPDLLRPLVKKNKP